MNHIESNAVGEIVRRLNELESALASSEKRVKELEAALRHEIANCVNCEGLGQFKCGKCADDVLHDCKRCAHARDALEAPHEP